MNVWAAILRFAHRCGDWASKYGDSSQREKGAAVDVIHSPNEGEPEVYTAGNRFLFTAVPIFFGVMFIVVGIGMEP